MFNKSMLAVALASALAATAGFAADNDVKQDTRDIRSDKLRQRLGPEGYPQRQA